uniref:hypothetical protein n=1 Tax=Modestobacter excelsi TaxID=2213161 RepID=UPI001C20D2D2
MTETTRTGRGSDLPDLRRLRYFHGQLLGARDFRREQAYMRDKLRLRMRHLLGYGVVCGLRVEPVRTGPYDQPHEAPDAAQAGSAAAVAGTAATDAEAGAESAGT